MARERLSSRPPARVLKGVAEAQIIPLRGRKSFHWAQGLWKGYGGGGGGESEDSQKSTPSPNPIWIAQVKPPPGKAPSPTAWIAGAESPLPPSLPPRAAVTGSWPFHLWGGPTEPLLQSKQPS